MGSVFFYPLSPIILRLSGGRDDSTGGLLKGGGDRQIFREKKVASFRVSLEREIFFGDKNGLCKVRQPQDDVRLLTDMIAEQIRDSWNLDLSGNEGTGMYQRGITAPGRCVYAGAEKQFYP